LFSVRTLEAHTKSQAMQNAVENARFAIETMNKKIRTSHDISDHEESDGTDFTFKSAELFFVDNVDGSRICYQFNGASSTLEIAKADEGDPHDDCNDFLAGDFTEVVGGAGGDIEVDGGFFIKQSQPANPTNERGFVRTVVEIKYNDGGPVAEKDTVVIQSGVSLRDY